MLCCATRWTVAGAGKCLPSLTSVRVVCACVLLVQALALSSDHGGVATRNWACLTCTTMNEPTATACVTCDLARPAPHPATAPPAQATGIDAERAAKLAADAEESAQAAATAAAQRDEMASLLAAAQAELEEMRDSYECPVCLDKRRDTVLGCGHRLCADCAAMLVTCHMCRKAVTQRITLYG